MKQPQTLDDLYHEVNGKTFKRITPISNLISDGSNPLQFFEELKEEIIVAPAFATYLPIIKETVNTKKHQYSVASHIVFWLDDGHPYIYTPIPTVHHLRVGRSKKEITEGSDLAIPSNCHRYDIIEVCNGVLFNPNADNEQIRKVSITRYQRG